MQTEDQTPEHRLRFLQSRIGRTAWLGIDVPGATIQDHPMHGHYVWNIIEVKESPVYGHVVRLSRLADGPNGMAMLEGSAAVGWIAHGEVNEPADDSWKYQWNQGMSDPPDPKMEIPDGL